MGIAVKGYAVRSNRDDCIDFVDNDAGITGLIVVVGIGEGPVSGAAGDVSEGIAQAKSSQGCATETGSGTEHAMRIAVIGTGIVADIDDCIDFVDNDAGITGLIVVVGIGEGPVSGAAGDVAERSAQA